jgi:hypothetical protein
MNRIVPENPMAEPAPSRQPKGDHNRRLSLGITAECFAAEAGIPIEALGDYERTGPDHRFDAEVARRVGQTLDQLEAVLPNSQNGRQHAAFGISVADVGQRAAPPIVPADEDDVHYPRYEPGGDV